MTMPSTGTEQAIPHAGLDVLEAIYTTRAMRRVKPDPIPDDVLRAIMDAAIRAPSGGNQQGWNFVVVRDAEKRRRLEEIYRPAILALFQPGGPYAGLLEVEDVELREANRRMKDSALYLGDHLHEAPVIVIACLNAGGRGTNIVTGSSIYPAVQNLMLAARGFGVGSALTTIHRVNQDGVRDLLGIPADVETAALVPLGYPKGRWGVAKRRPMEEVVFADAWGESFG